MNPRLEGIIRRFSESKGLAGDLPTLNEHFANYIILRDEYYKLNGEYPYESNIDLQLLENLNIGKNGTESIDGFFCVIENSTDILHIESTEDEIISSIKKFKNVKIGIVLVQSKISTLDPKDILSLQVRLANKAEKDQNNWKRFFDFRRVIERLLLEKSDFSINFSVVYFSGNKIDDRLLENPNFSYKITGLKEAIKDSFWIQDDDDANVSFVSGGDLMELYDIQSKTAEAVTKTVELFQLTDSIKCSDLAEMRLGSIKIGQLKEILYDNALKRPHQLYEYNVRHNLDTTGPNEKMTATLTNVIENFKFPLLNNGITMIVDSMSRKGDRAIELKNIRIVNGCQTSHVILKNCIGTDTFDEIIVPLKMISTENEDILGEITFSSNNQNPIKSENLISLNKKIIFLEKEYVEFSLVHDKDIQGKYFFERRQGQHSNINKDFVIDIPAQAKVFIASWLIKPHTALQLKDQTLFQYNEIINQYEESDLKAFYRLSILSGISWCKVYQAIKWTNFESARYHILCGIIFSTIRHLLGNTYLTDTDNDKIKILINEIEEIEKLLLELLTDPGKIAQEIQKTQDIIDDLADDLPKNSKGKVHYRKYYPNKIIYAILAKTNLAPLI